MEEKAKEVGKELKREGLVDGASGNISFRKDSNLVITKTGTSLKNLGDESFIKVSLDGKSPEASSDLLIHQAIYQKTDLSKVLHCHGVYNVVIGNYFDKIKPLDFEGKKFLKNICVIDQDLDKERFLKKLTDKLGQKNLVVIKNHGVYAAGNDLRKLLNLASYLEHSCEIIYLNLLLKKGKETKF